MIFGYTIFCDDIRQEINNKISYMGIYQDEIIVPSIPFVMKNFCMIIKYVQSRNIEKKPLKVMVYFPDDEEKPHWEVSIPFDQIDVPIQNNIDREDSRIQIEIPVQFSSLILTKTGRIKIRLNRGDSEILKLGSIMVTEKNTIKDDSINK
jgi:hypothetical protein